MARCIANGTPLTVLVGDLDGFKQVNDLFGHLQGNRLLQTVAAELKKVCRESDYIARMGGDEFTVLLTDLKKSEDAVKIAQKLLETIAEPVRVDGQELYVTTSIGIAVFPNDGESAESLLQSADSAMYRAKDARRNSYRLCTPAMNQRVAERLSTENALRRALDRGHLVRRLDPAWGESKALAKIANDDTFHFTNCTPQHENFNQSRLAGLWGQLENAVKRIIVLGSARPVHQEIVTNLGRAPRPSAPTAAAIAAIHASVPRPLPSSSSAPAIISTAVASAPLDSPAGGYSFDGEREGVVSAPGAVSTP